jgi:hypothetical protein
MQGFPLDWHVCSLYVLCGGASLNGLAALTGKPARVFTPHVTLLRDRRAVNDAFITPVHWRVDECVMIHSEKGARRHRILGRNEGSFSRSAEGQASKGSAQRFYIVDFDPRPARYGRHITNGTIAHLRSLTSLRNAAFARAPPGRIYGDLRRPPLAIACRRRPAPTVSTVDLRP